MAGGEAVGSAINTPAPGRASVPPGRHGRISARKACCAGTQNTSHRVSDSPAPWLPAAPWMPHPQLVAYETSTRSAEHVGIFQTGRHIMSSGKLPPGQYPPVWPHRFYSLCTFSDWLILCCQSACLNLFPPLGPVRKLFLFIHLFSVLLLCFLENKT